MTMVDLRAYTTLNVYTRAEELVELKSVEELPAMHERIRAEKLGYYILGRGANVIFRFEFHGTVIRYVNETIRVEDRGDHTVLVAAGGCDWCEFVRKACEHGWGMECLAGIPGTVGASPVQNIGAYGQEVKDTIVGVRSYDLQDGTFHERRPEELEFGYRDSLFKHTLGQRELIYEVEFRVEHDCGDREPYKRLGYGDGELAGLTPMQIHDRVLEIRAEKLPDIAEVGSVGSIFKNPVVSAEKAEELLAEYPDMPTYPVGDGQVKLSAAWLIDREGWKGYRIEDVGVWPKQPLVIVNYGTGSGEGILVIARSIQWSIRDRFGVLLEREVNVVEWDYENRCARVEDRFQI